MPPAQPEPSGTRPLWVAFAIVVGLLVLICSGVISYRMQKDNALPGTVSGSSAANRTDDGAGVSANGTYRVERVLYRGGTTR